MLDLVVFEEMVQHLEGKTALIAINLAI
jgi:hypothetical protein